MRAIPVALAVALLGMAAAPAAASGFGELSHTMILQLESPHAGRILATALFNPELTRDVRSGADLNEDGEVDDSEVGAFEHLMNERLKDRPLVWALATDATPLVAGGFDDYKAPSVAGPTHRDDAVTLLSLGSFAAADAPEAGPSHVVAGTFDAALAASAPRVALLVVNAPTGYRIAAAEGLTAQGACTAYSGAAADWSLTLEAEADACSESALEEAARAQAKTLDEEAKAREAAAKAQDTTSGDTTETTPPETSPPPVTPTPKPSPAVPTETRPPPGDTNGDEPAKTPSPGLVVVALAGLGAALALRATRPRG